LQELRGLAGLDVEKGKKKRRKEIEKRSKLELNIVKKPSAYSPFFSS
jgi:hypothetical protein